MASGRRMLVTISAVSDRSMPADSCWKSSCARPTPISHSWTPGPLPRGAAAVARRAPPGAQASAVAPLLSISGASASPLPPRAGCHTETPPTPAPASRLPVGSHATLRTGTAGPSRSCAATGPAVGCQMCTWPVASPAASRPLKADHCNDVTDCSIRPEVSTSACASSGCSPSTSAHSHAPPPSPPPPPHSCPLGLQASSCSAPRWPLKYCAWSLSRSTATPAASSTGRRHSARRPSSVAAASCMRPGLLGPHARARTPAAEVYSRCSRR
mmetsp:Transcript_2859/g.7119  ORF Transcript_2859/g.7119 Transcript_2859/m.7119 type:complete len:270 (+) Transcript_2859:551-1360(+)